MKFSTCFFAAILWTSPSSLVWAQAQPPESGSAPGVVGAGLSASGVPGRPQQGASGVVGAGMAASGVVTSKAARRSVAGSGMADSGIVGSSAPSGQ
jgi:hypothetical protein